MLIRSVSARAWTLPLRAPFTISQRVAYEAQNVFILVETDDSAQGFGAAAPVGYETGESVESVTDSINAFADQLVGKSIESLGPLLREIAHHLPEAPAARAGLEMAIYDAWAKHWHLPLRHYFGNARDVLTTDLTIPIVEPDAAVAVAKQACLDGFDHLKIKVGCSEGHEADLRRILAVAAAAPEIRLRIDANQAFTPQDAVEFVQSLAPIAHKIEMIEQPVGKEDFEGLRYVKDRIDIPLYADESARSVAHVLELIRMDAVDGINVKLMKSGIVGALDIITVCRAAGKKLMLGCMLETSLGIAAAAQIAAGTGAFDLLDLDSHQLLAPVPGLTGGFHCVRGTIVMENTTLGGWGVDASGTFPDGNATNN